MQDAILLENDAGNLIIRFTRPETRNPLSVAVLERLHEIFDEITDDLRKIIFTGTDDVFASGANLREIAETDAKTAREFALRGQNLMKKITEAKPLTIAAINGFCFGGALDLALSCNVRIAAPTAVFAHPGAGLGIITGWGGTQRLPRLVGAGRALEMFFTARRVSAEEALEIGLVDKISENPLKAAIGVNKRYQKNL